MNVAPYFADRSTQSEMIAAHCSARTIVDGAESLQIMLPLAPPLLALTHYLFLVPQL